MQALLHFSLFTSNILNGRMVSIFCETNVVVILLSATECDGLRKEATNRIKKITYFCVW